MSTQTRSAERLGFADALVRLSHLVERVFGEVSREHGLTPQQTRLLCLLTRGPMGMGAIGDRLNLEKSSLSGLVDRVERRGLVARVRDTADRRACQIELTGDGISLAESSHRGVETRLERLAGTLPATDRRVLIAATTLLLDGEAAGG